MDVMAWWCEGSLSISTVGGRGRGGGGEGVKAR